MRIRTANERSRERGPVPLAPVVGRAVPFTGRSYVAGRSQITVNCDDCMGLHHILGENRIGSSAYRPPSVRFLGQHHIAHIDIGLFGYVVVVAHARVEITV